MVWRRLGGGGVLAAALLLGTAAARPAAAQETAGLTLADALRQADAGSYGNRIADGRARAQAGEALGALQGILPTTRVEAGWARTTDPIGTFGMNLRQRTITQADFDPSLLNYPAARSDHGAALVVEQPLVNVDAWAGHRAGRHAADAYGALAEWSRVGTRVDVLRAWYGAVLMQEQVGTLEAAQRTASAHVGQAQAMKREGVVTRSDELLAQVRAGEVEAQLIEAQGAASLSRRRLALVLGAAAETRFALPSALPTAEALLRLGEVDGEGGVELRADVRAARAGRAAAKADAQRARATLLPRLNAQARLDWHSASAPFRGDDNWSVGVVATWTPFAGASQVAQLRATSGRAAAAAAEHDAAVAAAELEAAEAANAWRVAVERMRIAGEAVAQSAEALRIVTRRYDGGLAGVVELLDAAAAETESRLRYSHARYEAVIAAAERLRRSGRDPGALAVLLEDGGEGDERENGQ